MNRRQVLAVATIGVVGPTAGCLDLIFGEDYTIPDGMEVNVRYGERVLEDGLSETGTNPYHTLITDRATAEDQLLTGTPLGGTFAENTEFPDEFLVVVEYGASSDFDLKLIEIERMNGTLQITLSEGAPDGEHVDDMAVHSALIQITDEQEGVPDEVMVEVTK